jgi:hypothetical protein
MDLAWNAIDGGLPVSAEATGDPFNPEVTPVKLKATFELPANDWRPAIQVSWHQGGDMPSAPAEFIDLNRIDHGVMFKGSQGFVVADFEKRILYPYGKDADLTYFKRRTKKELIPPLGGFPEEWFKACKGNLKTSCDFDYAGTKMEMMMLGLVAYRVGKKLDYDGAQGRVTNSAEGNDLLRRKYREGWTLNG